MRIILDARVMGMPGIGRVAAGIWSGLRELGEDVVMLGSARSSGWLGDQRPLESHPSVRIRSRAFGPMEQFVVPSVARRRRADVIHSTHFNVPYLAGAPIVLTAYDLFPFLDQQNARSGSTARYYRWGLPAAVRRASMVVAISSFAAQQFSEHLNVPDEKLKVVELGLDHGQWRRPDDDEIERVLARAGVRRPYLLYVGTAKRHKNLATLLAAHHSGLPPLVLAGPSPSEIASIVSPRDDVTALGRVPDAWLPALYAGATALAVPSMYEAVGLTALEAMACGIPVVSSDGGGLPETVGDAAVLVSSVDVSAWRTALTNVVEDEQLRRTLVAAGIQRVKTRTWTNTARAYVDIYRSVSDGEPQ